MDDESMDLAHRVALFRYGLIAELLHLERGDGLYAKMREKAERTYDIPGTTRTRVAPDTLRDWLKLYRQGGFEALKPRVRSDHGTSRGIPREVRDLLVMLKEDKPELRIADVIEAAYASGEVPEGVKLKQLGGPSPWSAGGLSISESSSGDHYPGPPATPRATRSATNPKELPVAVYSTDGVVTVAAPLGWT